jgi:hypothetical protein
MVVREHFNFPEQEAATKGALHRTLTAQIMARYGQYEQYPFEILAVVPPPDFQ